MAEKLGFEKIILKNKKLIGYFVSNPASHFYNSTVFTRMMQFVKDNDKRCRMRQDGNKLSVSIQNIETVDDANKVFGKMNSENVV